jgi:hypothetical protein
MLLQFGLPLDPGLGAPYCGKALPHELYPTCKWGMLSSVRSTKMLLEMKLYTRALLRRKLTLAKCASILHTRFLQVLS